MERPPFPKGQGFFEEEEMERPPFSKGQGFFFLRRGGRVAFSFLWREREEPLLSPLGCGARDFLQKGMEQGRGRTAVKGKKGPECHIALSKSGINHNIFKLQKVKRLFVKNKLSLIKRSTKIRSYKASQYLKLAQGSLFRPEKSIPSSINHFSFVLSLPSKKRIKSKGFFEWKAVKSQIKPLASLYYK